jgi:hypothetical protein
VSCRLCEISEIKDQVEEDYVSDEKGKKTFYNAVDVIPSALCNIFTERGLALQVQSRYEHKLVSIQNKEVRSIDDNEGSPCPLQGEDRFSPADC